MTNLPITSSAPQAAASAKQAANNATGGDAQDNQPFGDVLARQISDPTTRDVKAKGKLADALAKLDTDIKKGKKEGADDKQSDVAATDTATTLPTDMLAALLPQTANAAAATPAGTANAKSDAPALDTQPVRDKFAGPAPKVDPKANVQAAVTPKSTAANPDVPAKEPVFAAAVAGSANRPTAAVAGPELSTAVREAIAVAAQQANAAPQTNPAALAALQNTAASLAAPAMQPVQVTVNTPVNQDRWNEEFSQKITWLATQNEQTAELHLNPPQLGPVDVVIKVSGDQATALFTSPHAAVRDAIEQAMPRLRDMMADNGIMLGNATVSDQAPRDQGQSGAQRTPTPAGSLIQDATTAAAGTVRVSPISRHNGIVDTFA